MKKILKISTLIALSIGLVSCGSAKLVGTWKVGSILGVELGGLTFGNDKSVSGNVLGYSFSTGCTYKANGSTLTLTCPTNSEHVSTEFSFSVEGDKLTLADINNPNIKIQLEKSGK